VKIDYFWKRMVATKVGWKIHTEVIPSSSLVWKSVALNRRLLQDCGVMRLTLDWQ